MDYYKRFTSLLEHVEQTCSKVVPVEIAKKSNNYNSDQSGVEDDERKKLLACVFLWMVQTVKSLVHC